MSTSISLQMVYGFAIAMSVYRILRTRTANKSSLQQDRIFVFILLVNISILPILKLSNFFAVIEIVTITTVVSALFLAKPWQRRFSLRKSLPYLLDVLLLQMRLGSSVREALRLSASYVSAKEAYSLREVLNRLEKPGRNTPFSDVQLEILFLELKNLETLPFKTIERLESFRNLVHKQAYYRQKSSQLAAQTRAQALVVTIIYLIILALIVIRWGFLKNVDLILLSLLLFCLGLFFIFRIGRRMRWKT